MPWPLPELLPFALFPLGWCALAYLVSWLGGWRALARHYRAEGPFVGTRYRFQDVELGHGEYGGCLTVGLGPEGLYLAVMLLFRPGHPPLFFPWGELTLEWKRRRFLWLWSTYLEVRARGLPDLPLRFTSLTAQRICRAAGVPEKPSASEAK
jgi:hypothetical protein